MNLNRVIDKFGSRSLGKSELIENLGTQVNITGSLGSLCSHELLIECLKRCCVGLEVTPAMVLEHLLSQDDIQDFADGLLTEEGLKSAICYWNNIGAPYTYLIHSGSKS